MSIFETTRPDSSNSKFDKALEQAIIRKNNKRRIAEERAIAEECARVSAALESIDISTESTPTVNSVTNNKRVLLTRNRALHQLEPRLVKEGYTKCLNNVLFGIVYESFYADDYVKEQTKNTMYSTFESMMETLDSLGIKPVSEINHNQLMKNIHEIVKEAVDKSVKRITLEANDNKDTSTEEDIDSISFSMTDSEMDQLDNDLSDLSTDEIAMLVKNKVLQVVQDEQISGQKKSETFDEIEKMQDELNAEETENDEEMDATESDEPEEDDDNTDTTEEGFTSKLGKGKNRRKMFGSKSDSEKSHKMFGIAAKKRKLNSAKESLMSCMMFNAAHNISIATESQGAYKKDIMDASFMDSMYNYTILETLQTIGMYDFTRDNINTICKYYKTLD